MMQDRELPHVLNRLAQTDDGKYFLIWLAKELGFGRDSLVSVGAQIDLQRTLMNEANRHFWLVLRGMMTKDLRNSIEKEL